MLKKSNRKGNSGRRNGFSGPDFCLPPFHPFALPPFHSSTHPCFRRSKSGFTLVELLVVLGITVILAGVAVASLSGVGTAKQQLRREAREVMGLFQESRRAAMERKLKVEVYVAPAARAVCAVESAYARKLLAADGRFFSDGTGLSGFEPESNRFFRVAFFSEEIVLDSFPLAEIEAHSGGEAPLFEPALPGEPPGETGGVSRPVFSFTQLGGATGGGVSVSRGDVRIDIACDLLTGMPELVRRRAVR